MQIVKYFGTRVLEHFVLLLGYSLVIYLALMLVNIHFAFFTFNLTLLSVFLSRSYTFCFPVNLSV